MAGINPISAALADAALTLGFPLEILQSQLAVGDVLTATVLPPQNGQDLIEILGQQVVAQLPPSVHPGDVLLLRVTGFSGNQVLVENLGLYDPQNPIALAVEPLPADAQQTATLTTVRTAATPPAEPQTSQALQAPAPQSPAQQTGSTISPASMAPPTAVFVAASVRAAPLQQAQMNAEQTNPQTGIPSKEATIVEARIAAAQTAKQTAAFVAPVTSRMPLPGTLPARVQNAVQSAVQTAADAVQRTVRSAADSIKALRLPDTPVARTAAAIAPQAASRVPSVLARLEAALPRGSSDPRIAALRTITAFVSRMNPQNEETLPTQISAYVSHVLEGAETKLMQLLEAAAQLSPAPEAQDSAPAGTAPLPGSAAAQAASYPQGATRVKVEGAPIIEQTAAQARMAERTAAIDHDLKSLVLSLLRDPPQSRTPALSQALNETLMTLTGAQIGVLGDKFANPGTIAFALPVPFYDGAKPAQIRISRDGSNRGGKLDADNFHIAFVLDTANLGTVAIDLRTTGRSVTIDVKTEQNRSASQFSQTLASLRTRLEDLRYRVASAVAGIAPRIAAPATQAKKEIPNADAPGLDMRA